MPASRDVVERLRNLRGLSLVHCGQGGATVRALVPYLSAINDEAKALIATPEGQALRERRRPDRERIANGDSPLRSWPTAVDYDEAIAGLTGAHPRTGEAA